jgi:hypothetical protein
MTIKIQCPCGVKYALDISAENLRNPVRFVCNQCGADNSGAINEIVRQQFAAAADPGPVCHHHSNQPCVSECLVCKRPICPECMAIFGYVCSAYCEGQAERAGVELPVYEGRKSVIEARFWKKVRVAIAVVVAALALLGGGVLWYHFAGSRPKAALTVSFPQKRTDGFCKFISQNQILVRHGNKLARYDGAKEVWSTHLIDPQSIEDGATKWVDASQFHTEGWKRERAQLKAQGRLVSMLDDEDDAPQSDEEQLADAREMIEETLLSQLRFHIINTDIWVAFTNKIAHIDWKTGAMDKEIPLTGHLDRLIPHESSLLALCEASFGEKTLTHVRLPSGEIQNEVIKPELTRATNVAKTKLPEVDIPLRAMTVHIRTDFADGTVDRYWESAVGTYFVNSGPNIAEMKVSMIEEKITQHRTMRERTGKSVLDGPVRVTQTAELANEILNDIQEQRTGGVRFEDESRYMITLRRKMAGTTVPDWVGEVKGPPQIFPLKTVDVLTAGKAVIVLDKQNQKRWETTLNYPASQAMMFGNAVWCLDEPDAFMPCLERGNTLFFFDQGVLAAFDIITGNARWRLPTVGVSALKFDDEGMMYVVSTSAEQGQIKYREQIDVRKETVPVIMKVDPRNGKMIWTLKQRGQSCLFSGKYFYAVEAIPGGGKRFGKKVPDYTRIYRLHPRDGRVMWDHVETQLPVDIDFRDNHILALFPKEVKVLKFLSL